VPAGSGRDDPQSSGWNDQSTGDRFEALFEKRAIVDFEHPIRDVNSVIGVDADQVSIKGRMMDFRQRQAIRDDRLPQLLNVSGIEHRGSGRLEIAQRPPSKEALWAPAYSAAQRSASSSASIFGAAHHPISRCSSLLIALRTILLRYRFTKTFCYHGKKKSGAWKRRSQP
jgi:hypothetical protein